MEYIYGYCELLGTAKFFSSKVTVTIDSGQSKGGWFLKADSRIKDASGNVSSFNSMVDALNYMGKEGWELAQAYVVTEDKQHVYHYLLKKRFSADLGSSEIEQMQSGPGMRINDLQDGDAKAAGIQGGDVIQSYGGVKIDSIEGLSSALIKFAGAPVKIGFLQGNEVREVSFTVGPLEAASASFLGIVKSGLQLVDKDGIPVVK